MGKASRWESEDDKDRGTEWMEARKEARNVTGLASNVDISTQGCGYKQPKGSVEGILSPHSAVMSFI